FLYAVNCSANSSILPLLSRYRTKVPTCMYGLGVLTSDRLKNSEINFIALLQRSVFFDSPTWVGSVIPSIPSFFNKRKILSMLSIIGFMLLVNRFLSLPTSGSGRGITRGSGRGSH